MHICLALHTFEAITGKNRAKRKNAIRCEIYQLRHLYLVQVRVTG